MRKFKILSLLLAVLILDKSTKATLFDACDHTYNLSAGLSYLESPRYPYSYPSGTSCRYKFIAPLDHTITANCTINLDKGPKGCSSEYFYISHDGDEYLRDSEQLCGSGTFVRKTSFRSLVLAYTSGGSRGSFRCQLRVQRQPCDCGWSVTTKINNGQETSSNEFPSMVALKDRGSNQNIYCGAVIISRRHLLTAAHCVQSQPNPNYIEAWVGRHNIESTTDTKYAAVYYISNIIKHPNYISNPVTNDIAIMVTTRNIEYSRAVGPICLPPASNVNNDFVYDFVDIIGWGTTGFGSPMSSILRKATVMVTDHETCSNFQENQNTASSSQICTYDTKGTGKNTCQFDSGGPVVLKQNRQFLVGIVSYGKPCGEGEVAIGFNTRVTSYLQWIRQYTGRSTCNVSL